MADDAQQPIVPRPKLPDGIAKVPMPMTTHLNVFGSTGGGKSYWTKQYVQDLVALGYEGIIFDWKHDRENYEGMNIVYYGTEGKSGIRITKDQAQLWVVRVDGVGSLVHSLTRIIHRARVRYYESEGKEGIPRPVVIAYEEVDTYQEDGDEVKRVFRQGRGNQVHGIAITPRPQDVAKEIFDNAMDGTIYFRFKDDIRPRLKARYGIEIPPEYWAHMQKKYHYVYYDPEGRFHAGYPEGAKRDD